MAIDFGRLDRFVAYWAVDRHVQSVRRAFGQKEVNAMESLDDIYSKNKLVERSSKNLMGNALKW